MKATRGLIRVAAAVALPSGAVAAAAVAWSIEWLACNNPNTDACHREGLAEIQLAVAGAAVALSLAVAVQIVRRRRLLPWLAAAVVAVLLWAVLADAAVHGWDDLTLVPSASHRGGEGDAAVRLVVTAGRCVLLAVGSLLGENPAVVARVDPGLEPLT